MPICPFCSLHCADLQIVRDGQTVASLSPDCPKAQAGFAQAVQALAAAPLPDTLQEARRLVKSARRPLIVIGGAVSCAAQQQAAALARHLNAWVDTPASLGGCALPWASLEAGWPGCTLGELSARAKTVVLLDAPLQKEWPRFSSRFLGRPVDPPTQLNLLGHELHSSLANNIARTEITTLVKLRLCLRGETGETIPELQRAAGMMQNTSWGVIVFGPQVAAGGRMLANELTGLIEDLSHAKGSRWQALYLPGGSNWPGASQALSSETGFPCAVRFIAHQAQFSPSEYSAAILLERCAPDLALFVGEADWLSSSALNRLAGIPSIVLSSQPPAGEYSLWLPSALPGIDGEGYFLRADSLPAYLAPLLPSQRPSVELLLSEIIGEDWR